jgi:hypothetical protein
VDEQTLQFHRGNARAYAGRDNEQASMLFVVARKSL